MSEQPQADTSIPDPTLPAQRPGGPDDAPHAAPGEAPQVAPGDAPAPDLDPGPRRWSLPSLLLLVVAAVVLLSAAAWHLGTVFLSIAPSNPASQRYTAQVDAHVYPEFEQNWQLFAPNPLQDNIHVQVRVQTLGSAGTRQQSGWIDLTAQDIAAIRDNPAPSHVNQNLLRRAWDYYTAWHDQGSEASTGSGGPLSAEYLKRLALQRLGRDWHGNPIVELELRSATTPLTGPVWTGAAQQPTTSYRVLPWWVVDGTDTADLGLTS